MTPLDKFAKRYWEEFYNGMVSVGLKPEDRPTYNSGNDTVVEMKRCLRHAMETLKTEWGKKTFDEAFPEPLLKRKTSRTLNDAEMVRRAKR